MNISDIDIDRLRKDLIEYFMGGAYMVTLPFMGEADRVRTCSIKELIEIAINNNFDLNDYIKRKTR